MTSSPQAPAKPPAASDTRLRLWLKPEAPASGYVDGAWWPRSRDLTAELGPLAEVLAVRLGSIERVAYPLSTWDAASRKVDVDGTRVRLEGFTYQDKNIIHMTGSKGGRISLLVVPPEMTDPSGRVAMVTAADRDNADRDNADRPEEILAVATVPAPREAPEAERWESDGGHLHRRD